MINGPAEPLLRMAQSVADGVMTRTGDFRHYKLHHDRGHDRRSDAAVTGYPRHCARLARLPTDRGSRSRRGGVVAVSLDRATARGRPEPDRALGKESGAAVIYAAPPHGRRASGPPALRAEHVGARLCGARIRASAAHPAGQLRLPPPLGRGAGQGDRFREAPVRAHPRPDQGKNIAPDRCPERSTP